jgi:hypothetical protein
MTFEVAKGLLRFDAENAPRGRRSIQEVGFRPRALLLWWSLQTNLGTASGNRGGISMTAGPSEAAATAWAADDLTPGVLSRWTADISLLGFEGPLAKGPALGGRVSWTDNGFVLEHVEDTIGTWQAHYLALGGADLQHAAVRPLSLARSGRTAVGGLGFRPDFLLFLPGAGGSLSEPSPGLLHAVGAASGVEAQVSTAFTASLHDSRISVSGTQRSDAVVAVADPRGSGELAAYARVASFDANGFTLETRLRGVAPLPLGCLALAGGRYAVRPAAGPATPTRIVSRGIGFEPSGLLAFTWGLEASAGVKDIGRLCLGAASARLDAGCLTWAIRNRRSWPPEPRVRSTTESLVEVLDTRSGSLHAGASLENLRFDAFTLRWHVSDGYRREFAYVAFGPAVRRQRFRELLCDVLRRLRRRRQARFVQ